ncbi:MAG TPA: hypothetical protein VF519_05690 [Mycobacteriales bacterium]|jgi:hypothetical protein
MRALVLAAALAAGLAAPAFAAGGGPGGGPGIHCEPKWAAIAEPTSEPLPVTLYAPSGMECW